MKIETKNAIIEKTMLGFEENRIMTFSIMLDYGGSSQVAYGCTLDTPIKDINGKFIKRVGTAVGMDIIMEILEVVGVDKWEDLKGQHIRVEADYNKVYAIGHYLKDNWLDFDLFFKRVEEN